MKIGIFSGSFDPVHLAHIQLASFIADHADIDAVWIMPSPLNPLKSIAPPVDFYHRYKMCCIASSKCRNVMVSDFEKYLPSPSFTYNTLENLSRAYPNDNFKLIIGSDNLKIFDRWRNSDKILDKYGLIVYPRPRYELNEVNHKNIEYLSNVPLFEISSSDIRKDIAQGKDVSKWLDCDVIKYIDTNHLYR